MIYNPANWYWVVNGSTTEVWSSAASAYVPVSDATYVAWSATGNKATAIDSEASLQIVLTNQYPAGWPQTPPTVTLADQASAMLANGVIATFTTTTTLSATYKTDLESQTNLVSESVYLASPNNTTQAFIGGDAELTLYDKAGLPRVMSVAVFLVFEAVYASWVKQVKSVRDSNSGTLPPDTITVPA